MADSTAMIDTADATVSTIPAELGFADALAQGLLHRFPDPLQLSQVLVYLPTRRGCRAVQEAFLRATGGQPLLLPRLIPLGDLDADELLLTQQEALDGPGLGPGDADLPEALPSLTRQLLLTRTILAWHRQKTPQEVPPVDQAARLAQELGRLLDQVETEGLSFDRLGDLVPEDYADHWQETLQFLTIITEAWPDIEAEQGCIGMASRRRLLHEKQAQAWRQTPPPGPIIAAGSTGSIPSTAHLLVTIAQLPRGEVVLPGLDRSCDDEAWRQLAHDPTHPQYGLANLLKKMKLARSQVCDWLPSEESEKDALSQGPNPDRLPAADQISDQAGQIPDLFSALEIKTPEKTPPVPPASLSHSPASRGRLINLALATADKTADWARWTVPDGASAFDAADLHEALAEVSRLDAPDPGAEAAAIALLLRQALETPEKTAALVTPDRPLARRVAAELRRWDIEVDDSAGVPLSETPPVQFLRLTAQLLAENCAPVALLSVLKHPLAAGGLSAGDFRRKARRLERALLRGPRPGIGFDGLQAALEQAPQDKLRWPRDIDPGELSQWIEQLAAMARPFTDAFHRGTFSDVVDGHLAFVEALAASDQESGADRLWLEEAGEAAATFFADLREASLASGAGDALTAQGYPGLLDSLLAGGVVRPRYGRHPRLAILGPLEARMQRADLLVLGGLNEGIWPSETDPGPWMSRPMRQRFGLPPVERRIGLSAHDFTQAMGAKEVVLTRAERAGGAPAVPSRWLRRLDALLEAMGQSAALQRLDSQWGHWASALDQPDDGPKPWGPPAPCPPLAARPKKLSVTRIETWMRDPYALYARHILKLVALDPLDADPGAADKGNLIHKALERFLLAYPGPSALPDNAEQQLLKLGNEELESVRAYPGVYAFWQPRFRRMATWVIEQERLRREHKPQTFVEKRGELQLDGLTLFGFADRIERLPDGSLSIMDYKTGQPPSPPSVLRGLAPQLPLEAAIAQAGGFEDVPAGKATELVFWRLSGGDPAGEVKTIAGRNIPPADELAEQALEGLRQLIVAFQDQSTAYHARPRPAWALLYNDYLHLSRQKEWSSGAEGEE
ncbi:double-strand break repair protein AddB [Rhodovibrionaceae bacterium A322]